MTQVAVVKRVFEDNSAEVCVTRQTACGRNCTSCEGCMLSGEIVAIAANDAGAEPGQRVIISSESGKVFSAVFLVYLLPVFLFIIGYALSGLAGYSENTCILISFLTLIFSAAIIILFNRRINRKGGVTYSIVRILEDI